MTSPFHEPTRRHALVLLDPTHLMGETALHYANGLLAAGDRVTLAVWPAGSSAAAIRAFARDDGRSAGEIADLYLDQAQARVDPAGVEVASITLPTEDLAPAILGFLARSDVTEVIVPATIAGLTPGLESRISLKSGVPVTVANGQLRRRSA